MNGISKVKGVMQDACITPNNLKITVVSLFVNVEENHSHICAIYFMFMLKFNLLGTFDNSLLALNFLEYKSLEITILI